MFTMIISVVSSVVLSGYLLPIRNWLFGLLDDARLPGGLRTVS